MMKSAITLALAMLAITAHSIEIIAHRGYSAKAPENTMAAFAAGWEAGTDACELDLHLTADDKVIICHDKDTRRTTGVLKVIAKTAFDELRKLDAGSWKGEQWKGEKLPTLDESISTLPESSQRFFLEIKCGKEVVPALARELARWRPREKQLAFISFDHEALAAAKKSMPWMNCYFLSGTKDKNKQPRTLAQVIAMATSAGLDGLDLGLDWPWSKAMVEQIHDAGLKVYAYTANKPADIQRLAAAGVDGITTDDPVLTKQSISTP